MCDTELLDKQLLYMPYIASEDTATWWRILKTGIDARGLDEPLTIYRRPGKSLSSNKFVALKRIWDLYRKEEGLGLIYSICNFIGWAVRATIRRI
jgi:teichuronic acid biosynthesis glycosyltransferase TuaG